MQQPVVAVALRAQADAGGVAAGVRLGQRIAPQLLAARERRQEARLLLGRPVALDRRDGEAGVHGDGDGQARVVARQLLDDEAERRVVEPGAAVLLGDGHAEHAELGQRAQGLHRHVMLAVPGGGVRRDFSPAELAHERLHLALGVGQLRDHGPNTGTMGGMADTEPALRLDVPRAEALAHATELIARAWDSFDHARPEQPPVDEQLRASLAAPIALGPTPVLQALDEAAVVLDHSIAQPRPRYFAFVASSGLEIAVLGDALAACHDVNLAVVSGAADLVERQTLEWLGQAFGYPVATGTFSSGGTVSNMTALAAARERALPGSRHSGLSGRPCALYASADVHESVRRAAELLGIGRDRVRAIPIDGAAAHARRGLRRRRSTPTAPRASRPIAVVATAGTTLTGAVDPLDELADVCAQRGVWLHVDGAYGLPAALVESHAPLFRGLARADSVTVDAHKWLFVPKACGVLMVREAEWLERAFTPRGDVRAPRARRAGRRRPYARVLAPVPRPQAVAGAARARTRRLPQRDRAQPLRGAAVRRPRQGAATSWSCWESPSCRSCPSATSRPAGRLDEHNRKLAAALRADGRVYVSGAEIDGTACLRPCFVNFRTSPEDVRVLRDVVLELGARLA